MAEEQNGGWNNQAEQPREDIKPTETIPSDAQSQADTSNDFNETTSLQSDSVVSSSLGTPEADPGNAAEQTTQMTDDSPVSTEQPTEPVFQSAPEYGAYMPAGMTPPQGAPNVSDAASPVSGIPASQQPPFGQPTQAGNTGYGPTGNPFAARQPWNSSFGQPAQDAGQPTGNGGNPVFAEAPHADNQPGQPQGFGMFPPANGGQPGGTPGAQGARRNANSVMVAVVAALVSAGLCLGVGYAAVTNGWVTVPSSSSLSTVKSNESGSGTAKVEGGTAVDWSAVAKNVSNSVVSIQAQLSNGSAAGSGAIIDKDGHVLTNNHVISGAQTIQVTLSNGNIYQAKVVGTDTTTDLAVIQISNPPDDLTPVTFANSDDLAVGENVMAIGNPLGYDDTATTGIVSALNRPVTVMDDNAQMVVTNAVQIDAAINPGNSGGPTFNAAGQVIGINSSIATTASSSSSEGGSIGIGFAIPSNLAKRVGEEIIKDGSVKHVALGVSVKSATVEADGLVRGGAEITTSSTGGAAVTSGGPADKAGLKANDTIVAFNGHAVNSMYSLLGFIRAAALGDTAKLTVVRDGKTMEVDVKLDQQEEQVNGTNRSESSNGSNSQDNSQQNQQDQQDQGGNGYDFGGLTDPFGLW